MVGSSHATTDTEVLSALVIRKVISLVGVTSTIFNSNWIAIKLNEMPGFWGFGAGECGGSITLRLLEGFPSDWLVCPCV